MATARAEYLDVDLGKKDFGLARDNSDDVKTSFSVLRATFAHKF